MHSFPILNQSIVPCLVLTVASWLAYRFLRRQVRWSGIPISLRIFQFVVIHIVKGFGVVNKADVFLELSCFFYDPTVWQFWQHQNALIHTLKSFVHLSVPSLFLSGETSVFFKSNCTLCMNKESQGKNPQTDRLHFKLIMANFKLSLTTAGKSNYMSKIHSISVSHLSFLTNLELLSSLFTEEIRATSQEFPTLPACSRPLNLSSDFPLFTLKGFSVPLPWPVPRFVHCVSSSLGCVHLDM